MQRYIRYTDKNGIKVEKKYSDPELIKLLHILDTGQKIMTIFKEKDVENNINLYIKFFNHTYEDDIEIEVCKIKSNESETLYIQFILELEDLLKTEFPDKYLLSQKEQGERIKKAIKGALIVNYKEAKILSNFLPDNDDKDVIYSDDVFLTKLKEDIKFLGDVSKIKVIAEYGGFLKEYNDHSYGITVDIKTSAPDKECTLVIFDWLLNYDGKEKIKAFMEHLSNIITQTFPEITLLVDYELKNIL